MRLVPRDGSHQLRRPRSSPRSSTSDSCPIRVDADERPDISERYSLGGWPTTAFLTPDGRDPRRRARSCRSIESRGVLTQVADAFAAQPDGAYAGRRERGGCDPGGGAVDCGERGRAGRLGLRNVRRRYGGFGDEPKFPAASLHSSSHWPSGRQRVTLTRRPSLVATLDAMGWSALYDDVDGGFFRYAATREWQSPRVEKLLDVNAALTRHLSRGRGSVADRRASPSAPPTRCATSRPGSPTRSTAAGADRSRPTVTITRARSAEARRALTAPGVDESLYADSNGLMVQAALRAAQLFDDDGLRDFAVKSLERVLLTCYKPGWGVAHYFDGHAAGSGTSRRPVRNGGGVSRRVRSHRQRRLRNDGRGARATTRCERCGTGSMAGSSIARRRSHRIHRLG